WTAPEFYSTTLPKRLNIVTLIEEAVSKGARKSQACEVIGISIRTLQRWVDSDTGAISEDKRGSSERPAPHNKLSPMYITLKKSTL
ncbi:helix-turn-helix domain-containing protein, partial [Vibrio campbellii]